jgi:hypothetical protein
VDSGTEISITCTPTGGGAWKTFTLVINTATHATALPTCGDTYPYEFAVMARYKPDVTVTLKTHPDVCSTADSSISTWLVSSRGLNGVGVPMKVDLVYTELNQVTCTMKVGTDVLGTGTSAGKVVAAATTNICSVLQYTADLPASFFALLKSAAPGTEGFCGSVSRFARAGPSGT